MEINMAKEEQIRKAIDNLDETTAKDALALLLADTSSGTKTQTANNPTNQEAGQFANFAQAILWLKSKYKFQELNAFTTEADLVQTSRYVTNSGVEDYYGYADADACYVEHKEKRKFV